MNESGSVNRQPQQQEVDVKKFVNDIHGKFNQFTGLEKLEGFSFRELLSDIFKHHGRDEVEDFFHRRNQTDYATD